MSRKNRPIGIFDSGVGGLTVVAQVVKELPFEDIVYFGDVARTPYGSKSRETVTRFSKEIAHFLVGQGVKMIIVACNTASSVALDVLDKEFNLPIIGVIRAGTLAALRATRNNRIGVIGTHVTIDSGSYVNDLRSLAPDIVVISQACPLFVPLVEEGWINHRVTTLVAKEYLSPLKDNGVDTLILGCTHYPFLKSVICETMGNGVALIDSAVEMARMARNVLSEKGFLCQGNRPVGRKFYLSDTSINFIELGERLLGEKMRVVTRVDVSEY